MPDKALVAAAEVIPYALPFRQPYVTARGELRRREMVLLRLGDEEGRVGLGEAVPLALRGGAGLETVVRELEALAELALLDPAGFADDARAAALSAPARCAVETALWDLGAHEGLPNDPDSDSKGNLDGGERRVVRCNATLVAAAPAEVAAAAERWAADGFGTFKLKLGAGDDVGQVRAVREALGPEARIRVDANASWSVEEAASVLASIERYEIELVEQPVASLQGMAALAARTTIPLAADESVASAEEARRAAELGACAMTGIKLSKVGGRPEAEAIMRVLPCYFSSALDGPVGIAAAALLAAELGAPDEQPRAHGLATERLFASSIAAVGPRLEGDLLHLPPGPGLGIEIDEDSLQKHRL
ncbi:MAG: mandelate racemase/muconate lactonizing enzyme family protein [Actinobacteria bacterium]|nr:mandelate racemase/muconate lactonizing enzyme family protein [Actinomycetota bacterium]